MILTLPKRNLHLLTSHHGRGNLLPIQKESHRAFYIGSEYVCSRIRQTFEHFRPRMSKRIMRSC
jgi:hypothetical protein